MIDASRALFIFHSSFKIFMCHFSGSYFASIRGISWIVLSARPIMTIHEIIRTDTNEKSSTPNEKQKMENAPNLPDNNSLAEVIV